MRIRNLVAARLESCSISLLSGGAHFPCEAPVTLFACGASTEFPQVGEVEGSCPRVTTELLVEKLAAVSKEEEGVEEGAWLETAFKLLPLELELCLGFCRSLLSQPAMSKVTVR